MIKFPFLENFTKYGALIILLFALSCKQEETGKNETADDSATSRPNIIYMMADDLTIQAISAYGGIYKDVASTPNMDRIADEGMLFQNVLCTNAICGPSRATILTSNYSNKNGYYKNESGGKFDASQWTFPQEFKKSGYQTSLFGKWHLGTEPEGFDVFKYHNSAGQQGLYWNPVYNENGKNVEEKGYATNLSTKFALDWLKSGRDPKKPFMMMLQFKAPHRPWRPDTKYETLWDSIEMPYPSTFDDTYKGRELTAGDTEMTLEYLTRRDMKYKVPENLEGAEKINWEYYGAKPGEVVLPEGMSKEEGKKWRYQVYIKDYLACVKSVDDNIGKVLDYLKTNGLEKNTIIVLTSDQGFYLGDHGFFDKRFIYEESLRMPFMVKHPGVVKSGSVNRDIISNIDFAPTLLELAGIKTSEQMQGESFASILRGRTPKDWQQSMYYHYYEFPFWHHVQPHYGIRTKEYTLAHFYYNIDVWELYDLKKDPDQMNNVINDPSYKSVVAGLKLKLKKLQKKYDDNKSLADYRKITDTDFGSVVDMKDQENLVKDFITK